MSELSTQNSARSTLPVPIPKINVTTRMATLDDLSFIDGLQKMHRKQVGWMPTSALEGKIKAGQVLIAESAESCVLSAEPEITQHPALNTQHFTPVGYCIGADQYFKRDDVGIIYQLNVAPSKQRGLIGATLIKAMFERAAYGCKLFCCWCAQDIEANRFWEALGFVPLAFRAGSRAKDRVHIFWQRRIRAGDTSTAWWFPSKTNSGSIREDRIVLPIPMGVRWDAEMPRILPALSGVEGPVAAETVVSRQLTVGKGNGRRTKDKAQVVKPVNRFLLRPVGFGAPAMELEKPIKKAPRVKVKLDPAVVGKARELRDRYLEHVNAPGFSALASGAATRIEGKYEVARLPGAIALQPRQIAA